MGLALAILYIDLVKAFDTIIRELAIGWPQFSVNSKLEHLCSIGLSEAQARDIVQEIDNHGSVLEMIGCHPHIRELLRSLHTGTWFKHGSCEDTIVTRKGVRQGCRFGGKIFNLLYGRALHQAQVKLKEQGIKLVLKNAVDFTPWATEQTGLNMSRTTTCVIDCTFVDDEAIII
eukprot:10388545-Karenia_brevis.AAC.1